MIRRLLIHWLVKLLNEELPQRDGLRDEMRIKMLARAYQNPALTTYLDAREEYVTHEAMSKFIKGEMKHPHNLAGQLIELRMLRNHMKACYNHSMKEKQKVSTREKLKSLRRREHTQ
jgi:hypothetical protein